MVEALAGEDPALYGPRFDAAAARYEAMHSPTAFAARVDRIAQQRGEGVKIAFAK